MTSLSGAELDIFYACILIGGFIGLMRKALGRR